MSNALVPNTILSHKGYSIKKASLPPGELEKLKKDLTVTPEAHPDYPVPNRSLPFQVGPQLIRIPRHVGLQRYGEPKVNKLLDYPLDESSCLFNGTLREKQIIPHNVALEGL